MSDDKQVRLIPFDQPSIYAIWVSGYINPGWSNRLEGMEVQPVKCKDGNSVTLLKGALTDQAALVGLINNLYQMHFVVLAVLRTEENGAPKIYDSLSNMTADIPSC
ncbi:MAG: hypothetical protein WAU00_13205 [Caldilinea sp.]|uniref:hypothetical protein n=1 Tax=Caldilinea sp. TaxID=2293560 RepID=UPI002CF8DF5B|nr:hypothetical protein [Caldilinea sp.]HRA66880.1 hypothetical protein [Caldilinea sp.]